jgi:hypothetical protein
MHGEEKGAMDPLEGAPRVDRCENSKDISPDVVQVPTEGPSQMGKMREAAHCITSATRSIILDKGLQSLNYSPLWMADLVLESPSNPGPFS